VSSDVVRDDLRSPRTTIFYPLLIQFNRNGGLYMFTALLAHPQEALQNDTWYIACVLRQLVATSVGVELVSETEIQKSQKISFINACFFLF
jgi:hypothetical protein